MSAALVLTDAEFHQWWCVAMVAIETAFAALLAWPFVRDYRQARVFARIDDLMAVADEAEEIGPAWERIPRRLP